MSDKKTNVAWISGAYYMAKSVFDKIKAKTIGIETFDYNEEQDISNLIAMINSNHCFGENRLITVYGLPEMTESEKKKLKIAIEGISDDILLVFFMIDPSDESTIFNSVEKIGRIYDFEPLVHSHNISGWLDKRIEELKIDLEAKAKIAIIDNIHYDAKGNANADILNSILQKLIMYAPGKKSYDLFDIISTSSFSENFIVWDLINSCDEKNFDKCLNLFHNCIMNNNNAISALNEIINVLVWKYRLLLFIKERKVSNPSTDAICNEASKIRKITYEGTGLNAKIKTSLVQSGPNEGQPASVWNVGLAIKAATSSYGKKPPLDLYNRKELYLIIKCLEDCLLLTRTCHDDSEACLIADIIFMTICSSLDTSSIKRLQTALMNSRI